MLLARHAAQLVIAAGNRAGEIISSTRRFLRKSFGEMTRVDLTAAIREILGLVDAEFVRQEIVVEDALESHLPPVVGDRVQLQQVALNLVMNAVEAMKTTRGRTRVLRLESYTWEDDQRRGVHVAVQDSGIGFSDAQRETVFETFFTTKPSGLGLGLSIYRSIVQAHGGMLWAARNVEFGATFHFVIPIDGTSERHVR